MIEPTDLIGVELGRHSVCASILDSTGTQLLGYADNTILSAEDTYGGDSRFPNPGPALAALWRKLKLDTMNNLRVAVTLGVGHSGIGSGPAIEQWVDSLAVKISDPITKAGDPTTGVSYIPTRHLGIILGTFQSLGVVPERIELPPVAVVRVLPTVEDYSVSVSSGIGWKARIHQGQVLEAVAYPDGLGKEGVHIEIGGNPEIELPDLEGVQVPSSLLADDRIRMGTLAVSVGAAKGLLTSGGANFAAAIARPPSISSLPDSSPVERPVVAPPAAQTPANQFPGPGLQFGATAQQGKNGVAPDPSPFPAPSSFPGLASKATQQALGQPGQQQVNAAGAWHSQASAAAGQPGSLAGFGRVSGASAAKPKPNQGGALDYSTDDYTEDRAALYEDGVSPALKGLVAFLCFMGLILLIVLFVT